MSPLEPPPTVGASLLAKVVNDDAHIQNERGVLEFFASKLAPTDGFAAIAVAASN